jgi:hypothetical protein
MTLAKAQRPQGKNQVDRENFHRHERFLAHLASLREDGLK